MITNFFNIRTKEKDIYNFKTAIYPYFKFHKKIFPVIFALSLDPVYVYNLPYFQSICCHSNHNFQHRKKKTSIISRRPSTYISSFIKKIQYFLRYHWIQFTCKICLIFSLFVAIATRIFNIGSKEKDVHNLQTTIYQYCKFHTNMFSTFCVIAGSSFED
jgi:hypothetical protein